MNKTSSKKGVVVWGTVTSIVAVLLVVVNILTLTVYYPLLNTVMPGGGERPQFDSSIEPLFVSDYSSKEEALEAANATNIKLCEEGMTLLKNNNNALPIKTPVSDETVAEKPKVSVFGKNSVNIAYGGSGSGAVDTSNVVDLYSALSDAGYDVNPVLKSFYEDPSQSGPQREANSSDLDSGKSVTIATAETPQAMYTEEVKQSYGEYNEAALVVFTRIGGEGFDLPRTMEGVAGANSADDTYLELDKNERDLLSAVCNAGFKKVVVIINSGSTMELTFLQDKDYFADADKIDAAVWMGYPGTSGTMALGRILNGTVNPSGKTVDTYASDLKAAPSFQNFGDNNAEDGDRYFVEGKAQNYYFVDYEESIYVGYRYYETRGAEDEEWYQENVVYPFGYGLSYTQFAWEIIDASSIENVAIKSKDTYTVKVKVTNTGSVAGKDVVQLYAHAPYTAGGIEKAEVVLVGFAKTPMLYPQSEASADKPNSCVVELSFDPYYLASYDYKDRNGNGFCGYELEAGTDYKLYVSKNAHDHVATIPFCVDKDIRYERDPVTNNKVTNLFTNQKNEYFNSDYQLKTLLSRTDWEGSFPSAPTLEDRTVDSALIVALADTKHNNPM